MKKAIKIRIVVIGISIFVILLICTLAVFFGKHITAYQNYHGNNLYSSLSSLSVGGRGYRDIDEAFHDIIEKDYEKYEKYESFDSEEVYRIDQGDYIWIFHKYSFGTYYGIILLELSKKSDQYYFRGITNLLYDSFSSFTDASYDDVETIRADIAHNLFFGIKEKNRVYPAWGVSENSGIIDASINGVNIDHVENLTGSDGKTFYFWIIENIGKIERVEDVENIPIEGI